MTFEIDEIEINRFSSLVSSSIPCDISSSIQSTLTEDKITTNIVDVNTNGYYIIGDIGLSKVYTNGYPVVISKLENTSSLRKFSGFSFNPGGGKIVNCGFLDGNYTTNVYGLGFSYIQFSPITSTIQSMPSIEFTVEGGDLIFESKEIVFGDGIMCGTTMSSTLTFEKISIYLMADCIRHIS